MLTLTIKYQSRIQSESTVDGEKVIVKLAIKKSPQKNKFWVHSIYTIETVSDGPEGADNCGLVAGKKSLTMVILYHKIFHLSIVKIRKINILPGGVCRRQSSG